jgi:glutamine synthetase
VTADDVAERTASVLERMRDGRIDTVLCALPDQWGRLVGKRVTRRMFLEHVVQGEGLHASLYLFTVDLDMEPLPGFAVTNWNLGFHDFRMVPDLDTLRPVPWLDATAIVLCDAVHDLTGEPVEVSPRRILRRQVERAAARRLSFKFGSELELFFFRDSYEEAWDRGYRGLTPLSKYRSDYHIFQTTKDEWLIRQIRQGMEEAGIPVEFSKGEWGLGQNEINLEYADALEMADRHVLYKNGVKEIAALNGVSATFMPKWAAEEVGSSFHVHASVWSDDGARPLSWDERAVDHVSGVFGSVVAGSLATARELMWMMAPYLNSYRRFAGGSFAPTRLTVGDDNRTCAFRLVGEGPSFRVENRVPGADANPYLVFGATIAGALHGIERNLPAPPIHRGNAYEAKDAPPVPSSLEEAVTLFAESAVAREAFGADVAEHLATLARHELDASSKAEPETPAERGDGPVVTPWEVRRYFERV